MHPFRDSMCPLGQNITDPQVDQRPITMPDQLALLRRYSTYHDPPCSFEPYALGGGDQAPASTVCTPAAAVTRRVMA